MKVMNNWWRTSIAMHSSAILGGYKNNVNKCGLFLKFSSVEKCMFSGL